MLLFVVWAWSEQASSLLISSIILQRIVSGGLTTFHTFLVFHSHIMLILLLWLWPQPERVFELLLDEYNGTIIINYYLQPSTTLKFLNSFDLWNRMVLLLVLGVTYYDIPICENYAYPGTY